MSPKRSPARKPKLELTIQYVPLRDEAAVAAWYRAMHLLLELVDRPEAHVSTETEPTVTGEPAETT